MPSLPLIAGHYVHAALLTACPHLLQPGPLRLLMFSCMKTLPALRVIEGAIARGELAPGGTVIETSSGTFALGLAMVGNAFGIRCIIVCDPAIDARLERRLTGLGCKISMVQEPAAVGGFQKARLDRLHSLLREHEGAYWPNQYANPDNPAAYSDLADALIETLGPHIALVATVGSGGSSGGLARRLRHHDTSIPVLAVDTFGSVIFGLEDGPRLLRGLGNSLLPKNVTHTLYDEVHFVDAATAFEATRELHSRHAIFAGPTTGAAWVVATWAAGAFPDRTVVAIGPDDGHRYLDTVYNDAWLDDHITRDPLPSAPRHTEDLAACRPPWTAFPWKRRTRSEVLEGELDAV